MKINKRGITLIEVLVSIFIVSFMLVGMMRLYALGQIQSVITKHKIMAINLAQAEIENLKNTGYEAITPLLSTSPPIYPLTQTVIIDTGEIAATTDDINGAMVTDISSISEGYKVIVTVSWTDYYGVITEVLESIIASRGTV
ncbi:MAG: prepilin-type N-terminal cleavage/methylation domain-containing protein [Candidatus Omnitrophica bacterium]|nr:prepilin-type N-terminal cleavage/methylation domain-containing protein [Candidatus Omnitrophota bacterium]